MQEAGDVFFLITYFHSLSFTTNYDFLKLKNYLLN